MYIVQRVVRFVQAAVKSYGPSGIKRMLWEKEYSSGKWNFADNTVGDCVYPPVEKYAAKGNILDLGCGSGNTGTELRDSAYGRYLGVDISEVCLSKATSRSKECGRAGKNRFERGDLLGFVPNESYDVILFRESMYHVPMGKIKATLDHYAKYLKDTGVFVVRMATADKDGNPKSRPTAMFALIEKEFEVLETSRDQEELKGTVYVFRPRRGANAGIQASGR